jgi:hypothetical protein
MLRIVLLLMTSLMLASAAAQVDGGQCSLYPGTMYVFLKPDAAMGAGHVGFGFVHGSIGYYGSIEGGGPSSNILNEFTCGTLCSVDHRPMIEYFRDDGYTQYAFKQTHLVDFQAALSEAERRSSRPYNLFMENCAHATSAVVEQFAYAILPPLSSSFPEYLVMGRNFAPRVWFADVAERDGWTVRSLR